MRELMSEGAQGDLPEFVVELLEQLGYTSERRPPEQSGGVIDFLENLDPDRNPLHRDDLSAAEQKLDAVTSSIHIAFQYSEDELLEALAELGNQGRLTISDTPWAEFDSANARSFMFVAAELKGDTYSRGTYAELTRAINRSAVMPTVAFLRTKSGLLTIAFVHRRQNRRDSSRDVLGKVSLIREINMSDPHRAHIDILEGLSVADRMRWISEHGRRFNFDGMLEAWLYSLDTQELNQRFYRDLARWFDSAVDEIRLPDHREQAKSFVIRLITRMIFVWFMKEKGLVSPDLFNADRLAGLLKEFDPESNDGGYYRAILQNLFFATLNAEIKRREFSRRSNSTHRVAEYWRYEDHFTDVSAAKMMFNASPFVNGGLFESRDRFDPGGIETRFDYFTDHPPHRKGFSVPNKIFFAAEPAGLLPLFERYVFTVEENTPSTQEVALDPELLGNVFENLLAAKFTDKDNNQQHDTGSYYTPKAVVDYIVEESLVGSLASVLTDSADERNRYVSCLRPLFDFNADDDDATAGIEPDERNGIVRAISDLKLIDLAVGSGAFPMSALKKLTLALRRLDPENELWANHQREIATSRSRDVFEGDDDRERRLRLAEINETFELYKGSDYGRKLFLIENNIFGVDIEPIACQIAKLRFFISLTIEQQRDVNRENLGFRALPNLDTNFVAANALVPFGSDQAELSTDEARRIQAEIRVENHRYFHAKLRRPKMRIRERLAKLRQELAAEAAGAKFAAADVRRLVEWDPFDESKVADWFDPRYMFGRVEPFDIVFGNPPYVNLALRRDLKEQLAGLKYVTYKPRGDVYQLFIERGLRLLRRRGWLGYIVSNSWMNTAAGESTRNLLLKHFTTDQLILMGTDVFENSDVDTCILLVANEVSDNPLQALDARHVNKKEFVLDNEQWASFRPTAGEVWPVMSTEEYEIAARLRENGALLKHLGNPMWVGITTGRNEVYVIDQVLRDDLVQQEPELANVLKRILRGGDLRAFRPNWAGKWLVDLPKRFPMGLGLAGVRTDDDPENVFAKRFPVLYRYVTEHRPSLQSRALTGAHEWYALQRARPEYRSFLGSPRLFWSDISNNPTFTFVDDQILGLDKTFMLAGSSLGFLCGVLNSAVAKWWMSRHGTTTADGRIQWKIQTVKEFPIANAEPQTRERIAGLTRDIHEVKAIDGHADISDMVAEIDDLVNNAYGLSPEQSRFLEEQ